VLTKERGLAKILSAFNLSFWISAKYPEEDFKEISSSHRHRLNNFLKEYLIFGGYPAVSLKENPLIKQRDLQEIYSLYIRRDIKDIGEIEDSGLRNGAINNFDLFNQRADKGAILENFVFSQFSKENDLSQEIRFWRSQAKNEVDFIWQKNINELYPNCFNYV